MASVTKSVVPGQRWALGLMGAFLLALSLTTVAIVSDARNRTKLENVSEPTAVGDPITLGAEVLLHPGREVVRKGNIAYFLQTNRAFDLNEYDVLKLGLDDSGKVQLYRYMEPGSVLVKIGSGKFIRLAPR